MEPHVNIQAVTSLYVMKFKTQSYGDALET